MTRFKTHKGCTTAYDIKKKDINRELTIQSKNENKIRTQTNLYKPFEQNC
jgi:hypothetical protein